MRSITGTVGSIVNSARRMAGMDGSADSSREAFTQEFGTHPPYQEASKLDREQFVATVVRPELAQRAQAMQDGAHGAGEAFARAYQVAVDTGLVAKGQTYRDYVDQQG
jgi:hypothetical protein